MQQETNLAFEAIKDFQGQMSIGTQYTAMPVDHVSDFGASFGEGRKFRYSLWRIWNRDKPLVMFIGLNPSIANETANDPTVKRVIQISQRHGYGGVYMMNVFPMVSTDPKKLVCEEIDNNLNWIFTIGSMCKDVVFAWGNFKQVKEFGMDKILSESFPAAKCLKRNRTGSPKHPLYCRTDTVLIPFVKK